MVTLLGNLGADAELKTTDKGAALKFRLATSSVWFDKENQKQERTEWHRVVVFGKRAESLAPHLKKGTKLFVTGELRTSSYDKEGQKHWSTEIVCDTLNFAGGPVNGAYSKPPPSASASSAALPF